MGDYSVSEAVERIASPSWPAFEAQLSSTGGCARPVRLVGKVNAVDPATGEMTTHFTTAGQPDGVLLKACGSRRATRCRPCSAVYKGDARMLVAAGLAGGKGTDESVPERPTVFATFTAPSFGAVHRQSDNRACHPGPTGRCAHGRRLACWGRHGGDDHQVGTPLCVDCYDYESAVIWNARVTELWRRTVIATGRAMAATIRMTVRSFAAAYRISYVKVVEYQRRGSVHVHAVLRVDARSGGPIDLDAGRLADAVRVAAMRVRAPSPWPVGAAVRWGRQVDVAVVGAFERRRVANYLAKYATKSADDSGALDHRITEADIAGLGLPDHLEKMVRAAWRMGGTEALAHLRLRPWAHCLGFRGHWLTKSRVYSTTFGVLRRARHEFRKTEALRLSGEQADADRIEIGSWRFVGVGHVSEGDALLARWHAEIRARHRYLAREAEREEVAA
ncbi:MAG TPA: replication initiator [Acidimicrobiales bacterium]|nr:replication initiator [Acidimicrobiales bacterium]